MAGHVPARSFSEANSAEAFAERLTLDSDAKAAKIIAATVSHIHDLIKKFRPTQDEWREVIAFLTDVGHASDERRQEWVLLSDLTGSSALVEEINSRRPTGATPNTIRGPFFRDDAPERVSGSSISLDGLGEPLMVSVKVQDLDGLPIEGAKLITWQANAQGLYENQQPDLQPEHNLRGSFRTDANGCVTYRSVVPSGYGVPCDGPVGRLLANAGLPLRRPANLHFVVRAPGFETITTHIYDAIDPNLGEDAVFSVRPELVYCFERAVVDGRAGKSVALTFIMVRAKQRRSV
ncbi:dioxygenase [Rhizobium sp. Root1220]|uniref:dioxygenase family protein n=1 Tax=Rhizobium sp. Root1220 TaxID=1736432 RepID=UPI0007015C32|nr:dioxygenase [Rhizobium sp. Root1220]KQV64402.1 6-chlorohydroxyquinol-1,2-dioxygenase [Rhizobium sp. Root1220]